MYIVIIILVDMIVTRFIFTANRIRYISLYIHYRIFTDEIYNRIMLYLILQICIVWISYAEIKKEITLFSTVPFFYSL